MLVNVNLTQTNRQGNKSFEASKKVNIGDSGIESVSLEISDFINDLQKLIKANLKLGYNPVNGLKKSLPLTLTLATEEDTLVLSFKNFGKFADKATKKQMQTFLSNNIEFADKWGNS